LVIANFLPKILTNTIYGKNSAAFKLMSEAGQPGGRQAEVTSLLPRRKPRQIKPGVFTGF
jgi:hypothetical protein